MYAHFDKTTPPTVHITMSVEEMTELLEELEQRPIPPDQMMVEKLQSLLQWVRMTAIRATKGG